ncbi:class I SAM-dependent methyltransferase [bacterium]|nr:MAG: class I SAM-dependent methyltransferase [bacterium]
MAETKEWDQAADAYLKYFNSETGKLVREILDPVTVELLKPKGKTILDLCCGEGYLARSLKQEGAEKVVGADFNRNLLELARNQDKDGEYQVFDLMKDEPFAPKAFNAVIANMCLMDMPDISLAYEKIKEFLGTRGELVISIANPYYAYPVGMWKKTFRDILSGNSMPSLLITNYFEAADDGIVMPNTQEKFRHYHWKLSQYINFAKRCGFELEGLYEPEIGKDALDKFAGTLMAKQAKIVPLFLILKFKLTN